MRRGLESRVEGGADDWPTVATNLKAAAAQPPESVLDAAAAHGRLASSQLAAARSALSAAERALAAHFDAVARQQALLHEERRRLLQYARALEGHVPASAEAPPTRGPAVRLELVRSSSGRYTSIPEEGFPEFLFAGRALGPGEYVIGRRSDPDLRVLTVSGEHILLEVPQSWPPTTVTVTQRGRNPAAVCLIGEEGEDEHWTPLPRTPLEVPVGSLLSLVYGRGHTAPSPSSVPSTAPTTTDRALAGVYRIVDATEEERISPDRGVSLLQRSRSPSPAEAKGWRRGVREEEEGEDEEEEDSPSQRGGTGERRPLQAPPKRARDAERDEGGDRPSKRRRKNEKKDVDD